MTGAFETLSSLLLLLCGLGPAPAQEPPDRVLTGGRIRTRAEGGEFVEALAIQDGLVLASGRDQEILALCGEETERIELEGRTVIPGLNDSHLHVVRGGRFHALELRWDTVRSLREGLDRLREQAARTPPGQWVRVIGGWSPEQFEERRMPTLAELNEAAPSTPVFVLFLYSKGFLNRAGVEALALSPDSEAPKGGRYVFRDGGAEPLAEPSPTILYRTIAELPGLDAESQLSSTRHFYRLLNRYGLTSAVDAGGGGHVFPSDYASTRRLARLGGASLRISYYLFPQRPGAEREDFEHWSSTRAAGVNADLVHQDGYVLEGAGEFLVWSAGDFENFLAPRPELQRQMDLQLEAVATLLVQRGWPFRIHATYGESIERILDVLEKVDSEHPFRGTRWLIDHAETVRPEQIERIQRLGGGVAIQNRMAFAGELFLERYGPEAAAKAPPLRALKDSGIPLAAGTDATRVSSSNPWLSLAWMVSGRTVGGTVLTPPELRLDRLEALHLFTVGSAWVTGEEGRKGRLEPGCYADLAVLSADYFTIPESQIGSIESVLTLVGGEVVFAAGPYAERCPPLAAVQPPWSPIAHFDLPPGLAEGAKDGKDAKDDLSTCSAQER